MILLAGTETERAWYAALPDAPDGWADQLTSARAADLSMAVDFGFYVCGGCVPELEAYLEWLRQKVLGFTGRGAGFSVREDAHPFEAVHCRYGDERLWAL